MDACGKCEATFDEGPPPEMHISCKFCDLKFHPACAGMNKNVIKFFMSNNNYMWYCDNCVNTGQYHIDIMKKIHDLELNITAHTDKLKQQSDMINDLKRIADNAITPKSAPRKAFSETSLKWSDLCHTPRSSTFDSPQNRRKRSRKDLDSEKTVNYAPILIVNPKNDTDVNVIKNDIKSVINPIHDPVREMKSTNKGKIVIKCKDHESIEDMKKKLHTAIGDKYEINTPKEFKPMLKLVGLNEFENEENLLRNIRVQNDLNESNFIEIVKVSKIRRNNTEYYTVLIRTDSNTFKSMMKRGRINIMWDRVKCYEYVNPYRCFKCSKYGHKADECKDDFVCPKCSKGHKLEDCNSDEMLCSNCTTMNNELKLNLDVKHCAWDQNCPVLIKRMQRMRNTIRYEK